MTSVSAPLAISIAPDHRSLLRKSSVIAEVFRRPAGFTRLAAPIVRNLERKSQVRKSRGVTQMGSDQEAAGAVAGSGNDAGRRRENNAISTGRVTRMTNGASV